MYSHYVHTIQNTTCNTYDNFDFVDSGAGDCSTIFAAPVPRTMYSIIYGRPITKRSTYHMNIYSIWSPIKRGQAAQTSSTRKGGSDRKLKRSELLGWLNASSAACRWSDRCLSLSTPPAALSFVPTRLSSLSALLSTLSSLSPP